ncbi:MAG TPA: glycerol-3-phosphate 1-O-acyltransferase PlsY [Chthoniobacterales bacterium]
MYYLSLSLIIAAAAGYLLGSCPNGLLICNALGINIRGQGSGNIGATNVLRVVGKKWGYTVFALDALKGFLAVLIALIASRWIAPEARRPELVGIVAGIACVLGHTFPVWLRFHGGKGVATSAGVLLGLMPIAVLSVFVVWLLLFQLSRYVSVGSIGAAIALPIFVAIYLHLRVLKGPALLPFSILIAAVVVWRHRSNLRRLYQGEEERFRDKLS